MLCNSEIKFNAFLDFAIKTDAEALATGHYCQLAHTDDGVKLMRGAVRTKIRHTFYVD